MIRVGPIIATYIKRQGDQIVDPNGRPLLIITEAGNKLIPSLPEGVDMVMRFEKRDRRGELNRDLGKAEESIRKAIAHKDWVVEQIAKLEAGEASNPTPACE